MTTLNRITVLTLAAGLALATGTHAQVSSQLMPIENVEPAVASTAAPISAEKPVIEVVFVLDTTGSMSGLLQGAKEKIWSIANAIATAQPTPDIKIGLVGYRDRGDAYITVRTAMTSDLDAIYSDLMKYEAVGGGDGPESVNQALNEAVTLFEWSSDENALKLIYLVGDAPPHMDYQDDVRYHDSCAIAAEVGIIINTIQCGNMSGTDVIWQEIARLSEGEYFAIDPTGGMLAVATPYDEELARLGADLDGTLLAYGDKDAREALYSKLAVSEEIDASAPAGALADRARYKAGEAGADSLTGRQELVRDIAEGRANLDDIKENELPEIMQTMTPDERVAYVKEQQARRDQLRRQITEIDGRRQAFLKDALAEHSDGFDQKVMVALRLQAARKGIVYEVPDEAPDEEGSNKYPVKDDK
ncbi:MAG: VWA domain-containing protein [Planctomycetes bacterium]|nr:VWA domain-containing protein [Planctomycetota bacterium]